jgi:hypothetical protein
MHNDLPIHLTLFQSFHDNAAKSALMTWGEIASMLSAPHAAALSHKSLLPLFSPWRYKDAADPTVSNGLSKDGKPLRHFSNTHVRRLEANLVEMTMMVLDFDGGSSIEQAMQAFRGLELVGHTTLNHQAEGKDQFRIAMPYTSPMPVKQFPLYKEAIARWAIDHGADASTADIGRMFSLPAVSDERRHLAQSWYQPGAPVDWHMFDSVRKALTNQSLTKTTPSVGNASANKLMPDQVLDTSSGLITVRDINRKISNVRCPFHNDQKPTEFVAATSNGRPYLVCKKCGTVYMERIRNDGIVDGIARILAKKKQREGNVQ